MKKILTGIFTLLVPMFLFAQTAKETQDLSGIQKKISSLEKENSALKKQIGSIQKTILKMNEAEAGERLDLAKHDSLTKAGQDTVKAYSAKIMKLNQGIDEIESALVQRSFAFLAFLVLILAILGIRWIVHRGSHRKELDDILGKLNAQREERERRVAELRALIEQSQADLMAMKKETGERLSAISDNVAHVDKNLQNILAERAHDLEQQLKEGFNRMRIDHEEAGRELQIKIEDVRAMATVRISELGQKFLDSGKKLDDQITAAHKKTEELRTVLAHEIEAIRSKVE